MIYRRGYGGLAVARDHFVVSRLHLSCWRAMKGGQMRWSVPALQNAVVVLDVRSYKNRLAFKLDKPFRGDLHI